MAKHNVDLSQLSQSQLEELIVDAHAATKARAEEKSKQSLKKLKDSGELKVMKDELKSIKADAKELSKAISFELTVPISFTLKSDFDASEIEFDPDYIFSHTMAGTIPKDNKLTPAQLKILKPAVEEYVENACSDIFDIMPKEFSDKFSDLKKRCVSLHKQAKKNGFGIQDL